MSFLRNSSIYTKIQPRIPLKIPSVIHSEIQKIRTPTEISPRIPQENVSPIPSEIHPMFFFRNSVRNFPADSSINLSQYYFKKYYMDSLQSCSFDSFRNCSNEVLSYNLPKFPVTPAVVSSRDLPEILLKKILQDLLQIFSIIQVFFYIDLH